MSDKSAVSDSGLFGAALVEQYISRDNSLPGDYTRDGILMCGKCHTPKRQWQYAIKRPFELDGEGKPVRDYRLVPVYCKCKREEFEQEQEQDKQQKFELWMDTHRQYGISGGLSKHITFNSDDGRDPEALDISRRYVDCWSRMRENNIGIRFHGPNGTGKSFHAGMIVNALLKKRVRCIMTSFPTLLGAMEKWGEKTEIVNYLGLFDLVVIDDLGAERSSGYSFEQIYHIIDARYRQGKPLIITTNLLPSEIKSVSDITLKRIFDRVLEMCPIELALCGMDRRTEMADEKKRLAAAILEGEYQE